MNDEWACWHVLQCYNLEFVINFPETGLVANKKRNIEKPVGNEVVEVIKFLQERNEGDHDRRLPGMYT